MGFPIKFKVSKEGKETEEEAEKVRKELLVAKATAELEKRKADERQALREAKEEIKKQKARAGGTRMARAKERFQKVGKIMHKVGNVLGKISEEGQRRSERFAEGKHGSGGMGFFGGGNQKSNFSPLLGNPPKKKKKGQRQSGFQIL
jgi:hypothetical protein